MALHPDRAAAGLSAGGQHADRVRVGRRDRRLASIHRQHDRRVRRSRPHEFSSGASRTQGAITKTDNTHVRPLLVEAAWHHRARYRVGGVMRARWDRAPAAARARGDVGNRRLHARWVTFNERRKRPTVANVAIARELAGWCWSLAVMAD